MANTAVPPGTGLPSGAWAARLPPTGRRTPTRVAMHSRRVATALPPDLSTPGFRQELVERVRVDPRLGDLVPGVLEDCDAVDLDLGAAGGNLPVLGLDGGGVGRPLRVLQHRRAAG